MFSAVFKGWGKVDIFFGTHQLDKNIKKLIKFYKKNNQMMGTAQIN